MIGRRAVLGGAATLGLGAWVSACSGAPSTSALLRGQFEASARDLLVPGAAMLLRTTNGELTSVYGSRTAGGPDPVTLADHVRIGSITKTFTVTVMLQLAQEGKLDIDAPVSEYRADVPNGRDITLTQLMNMRSGLFNYSESLELNQSLDADPTKIWTPEELLRLGLKYPPYFPPGSGYHYSNTNTVLLGLIAEQLDKRPLAASFQTRLFTPLAMHGTTFPDIRSPAIPHHILRATCMAPTCPR